MPRYVNHVFIFDDPAIFVVSPAFERTIEPLPLLALNDMPLIAHMRGYNFWRSVENYLEKHGVRVNIIAEADNFETIKAMISQGLGASFIPLSAVKKEIDNGRLAEAKIQGYLPITRRICALYKGNRILTPQSRAFLKALCDYFKLKTPRQVKLGPLYSVSQQDIDL